MACVSMFSVKGISKIVLNLLGNFCCWYVIPLIPYCLVIAIVGLIVTTLDIYRVLADGPILSDDVWPMRRKDLETPISEEAERDVKLLTAMIEWTMYCCLYIGTYYEIALFLLPWLLARFLTLLVKLILCCVALIYQKPIMFSTMGLIGQLLEVHNLLYVSCFFKKLAFTYWF